MGDFPRELETYLRPFTRRDLLASSEHALERDSKPFLSLGLSSVLRVSPRGMESYLEASTRRG